MFKALLSELELPLSLFEEVSSLFYKLFFYVT